MTRNGLLVHQSVDSGQRFTQFLPRAHTRSQERTSHVVARVAWEGVRWRGVGRGRVTSPIQCMEYTSSFVPLRTVTTLTYPEDVPPHLHHTLPPTRGQLLSSLTLSLWALRLLLRSCSFLERQKLGRFASHCKRKRAAVVFDSLAAPGGNYRCNDSAICPAVLRTRAAYSAFAMHLIHGTLVALGEAACSVTSGFSEKGERRVAWRLLKGAVWIPFCGHSHAAVTHPIHLSSPRPSPSFLL